MNSEKSSTASNSTQFSAALERLVSLWREVASQQPPYVHPRDLALIEPHHPAQFDTFDAFVQSKTWGQEQEKDPTLHLGLLPVPYRGDLNSARVFLLTLNPSLEPISYFERTNRQFFDAEIRNLRQECLDPEFPFMSLDPRNSWHNGFSYWSRRFAEVIRQMRSEKLKKPSMTYRQALSTVAKTVAVLELVPYRSRTAPGAWVESLDSTEMMREFANALVQERKHPVIILRAKTKWRLESSPLVILSDNRGSWLNEEAQQAILGKAEEAART